MKKGKRKEEEEEEEDEEIRSGERKAESSFGGIEAYRKDLESQSAIEHAREEGSATAEAGSSRLTEDQINMVYFLLYQGESHDDIMDIIGVDDGASERLEVGRFIKQVESEIIIEEQPEGEHGSKRLQTEIGTKWNDRKGKES